MTAVHDLGGDGPTLVMAHGAGLHGLVLAPLARELAGRLHCVSFDHRGHGDTPLPPGEALDWYGLAADVLAVVDRLGLVHPYGFGHSSGGTAVLMAEQARPGTFAGLYCYEPVLVAADPPLGPDRGSWLAEQGRRRRTTFPSREDAMRHFSARPPFDALDPEVLRAYVDHGVGADDGRLKCRPEDEAAVYETATAHDAYARLPDVACPVVVACGSTSDACPPADVVGRLPQGRTEVLDGLGHLGPLERPAEVASSILRSFP